MLRCPRSAVLISLLFVSALLSCPSMAQSWDPLRMEPTVFMNDLTFLPDGDHGWAVGHNAYGGQILSSILRTTNGGTEWERLAFAYESTAALNGVAFVSATRGWVVGEQGRIYATTDGGENWSQQASGTNRKLAAVFFLDEQTGWITGGWGDGSSYLVLKTTNGGTTWQNLSFGGGAHSCEDIFFSDPLNGWVCGRDGSISPQIHRTTDGGSTWSLQFLPQGAGIPTALTFVSDTEGWASTSSLYENPPGAILHTTDGGDTWKIQFYTNRHYNDAIDAKDSENVVVVSVQILSPQSSGVFVTHDGGTIWTESTPPSVAYSKGVAYVGDEIWYCSAYGQILHSPDEGAMWDWDYYAPYWKSMAWSDPLNAWLVTGTQIGTDGYCFRTYDGGATWSRDPDAPGGAVVQFFDSMTGWMLKEGSGGAVWRTTDGGANWSRHTTGGAWIDGMQFVTPMRGWVHGGNGTMRRTTDGGVTWSTQSLGTGSYCDAAFFVDEDFGWAGGGYGGGSGYIRHTTDGGETWTPQSPATGDHLVSFHFLDRDRGWALGYNGRVQRTSDGGTTWEYAGTTNRLYAYEISMSDEMTGWVSVGNQFGGQQGHDGRGYLYRTTDGGSTWIEEWESPWIMGHVYDLSWHPEGRLWACGHNATVLRRLDPAAVAGAEAIRIDWSIGPNPFTDRTRFLYQLASEGPVSVVIYDTRGRTIRRLVQGTRPAGSHEVVWNGWDGAGHRLPSGVYFARLAHAAGTETRTILLNR